MQDSLKQAFKGRTTVVIAHRLSTVRSCDQIAVVEGGRIVEIGTHDELMQLKGSYFDLVRTQLSKEGNKEI